MTSLNGVYTPSPEPKAHPRVRPEAVNYAERNRGDSEKWYDYSHPEECSSPRPIERIISEEARRNAEVNKGSMTGIMGGYCDPSVRHGDHQSVVKSEAPDTVDSSKGRSMKNLVDNYENLEISERSDLKVMGDNAEEYADHNKSAVDNVIGQYDSHPPLDRPAPNLGHGGDEVVIKHTDADTRPILRMEGELAQDSHRDVNVSRLNQVNDGPGNENPPAYRTKQEVKAIVQKNGETVSNKITRREVTSPSSRQLKMFAHIEDTLTPRKPSSPIRTRPEAMQNYQKNAASEMAAIMRGEAIVQSPCKKHNPNFYRSEDW